MKAKTLIDSVTETLDDRHQALMQRDRENLQRKQHHAVVKKTKTRAEMKATPHSILPDKRAILPDGSIWVYDDRFDKWSMMRGPDSPTSQSIAQAAASDVPPNFLRR